MGNVQLPTWTAMQTIVAPRAMLGPFMWWVLGGGLDGITLAVPTTTQAGGS